MNFESKNIKIFEESLKSFLVKGRNDLPWRVNRSPYYIFVSEIMLQQTQVDRVVPLFNAFVNRFSTFSELSRSTLSEILPYWIGLGYNRRARYLKDAATIIVEKYNGSLPTNRALLESLPGIGKATSGSILVYAFNLPELYIETNIRAVIIHHFFEKKAIVSDSEILSVLSVIIDRANPFDWYSAMMDYGSQLKKIEKNPSKKSSTHVQQKPFNGSRRQVRGSIIRLLSKKGPMTTDMLSEEVPSVNFSIYDILSDLQKEGFLVENCGRYSIT